MTKRISVYIAQSLDGYIADQNGGIDWLNSIPNPEGGDHGFGEFMERTDAILMGRKTFEVVTGFDIDWPYSKPVFVVSRTLEKLEGKFREQATLVKGTPHEILNKLHNLGHDRIYLDGGTTIQRFLREELVDELIIATFPVLLGGGAPLFGDLSEPQEFEFQQSRILLGQIVQNFYLRKGKS